MGTAFLVLILVVTWRYTEATRALVEEAFQARVQTSLSAMARRHGLLLTIAAEIEFNAVAVQGWGDFGRATVLPSRDRFDAHSVELGANLAYRQLFEVETHYLALTAVSVDLAREQQEPGPFSDGFRRRMKEFARLALLVRDMVLREARQPGAGEELAKKITDERHTSVAETFGTSFTGSAEQ